MKKILRFSILTIIIIVMLVTPIVPVIATSITVNVYVAKIGDTNYATLDEAISSVPTDGTQTTITLLKNVTNGTGFKVEAGQNIIVDFNNFSYDASNPLIGSTGTETNGCQLLKGSTVTFKNGTLISTAAAILIQNYSNLTLKDMTIDTTLSSASYASSNNCGVVNIIGNTTIRGKNFALDMCWAPNKGYPEGTQITLDTNGTIKGNIELGLWGTMSTGDIKSTLVINNVKHEGQIIASETALKGQVKIYGGVFSSDVTEYVPKGYTCKKVDNKYVVEKEVIPTKQEAIIPTIDTTKEVITPTVGVSDSEKVEEILLDALKEAAKSNNELANVISTSDVEVVVDLQEVQLPTVDEELAGIINVKVKDIKIAKFFDISLLVKSNGQKVGELNELSKPVEFTIALPKDLQTTNEGIKREFYIVREHNGKKEIVEAVLSKDGKFITFSSDKYSLYTLAYVDTVKSVEESATVIQNKDKTPKTGENILESSLLIIVITIMGIIAVVKINIQK